MAGAVPVSGAKNAHFTPTAKSETPWVVTSGAVPPSSRLRMNQSDSGGAPSRRRFPPGRGTELVKFSTSPPRVSVLSNATDPSIWTSCPPSSRRSRAGRSRWLRDGRSRDDGSRQCDEKDYTKARHWNPESALAKISRNAGLPRAPWATGEAPRLPIDLSIPLPTDTLLRIGGSSGRNRPANRRRG